MSASVEPELSLTSSKPAPSAGRSGMLGLCRFGTIGFAAVVLAFALGYVAPEAALAVQSKDYAQPARSKDRDAKGTVDRDSAHRPSRGRVLHGPDFNPPYADILVDDNSGQVLHETSPDSPRYPASLTKIMTLYLLFEQLQTKKLNLDSRLQVSAHASTQAPTKLGLKPNETITVEEAIKAIVTRSANDAAVVVAEAIAGSEPAFATLMTDKAQMLGMANTVYINASGLPANAQITTAREQALLGRAIQERFPEYSRYFAIPGFQYHGIEISAIHSPCLIVTHGAETRH